VDAPVVQSEHHLRLGILYRRLFFGGAGLGVIGLGVSLLAAPSWERLLKSYLFAFVFVLTLSLGGLFFTAIQHATRAGWSVSLRRLFEALAGNLQWLWILFVPVFVTVLLGKGDVLYHWLDHGIADPTSDHYDEVLAGKAVFLNKNVWIGLTVGFFALWAILGRFIIRTSIRQDATGDVKHTHRLQGFAPLMLIVYALTQSLAACIWIMALEAHWFSTMFGVYLFASTLYGFFAVMILIVFGLQRAGKMTGEVTLEHWQDLGKFLFAFTIFHAYIAFSQYMLIWYGNIPEETTWYIARTIGPWQYVSWLIVVGHFAVPFLLLITKHTKRIPIVLAGIAAWALLMHAVDMYWLVMPTVPAGAMASPDATSLAALSELVAGAGDTLGFEPHLIDLTCLLGLFGFFMAGLAQQLKHCLLVPAGDPRLGESLAFENM
jgi:hypothetical protein